MNKQIQRGLIAAGVLVAGSAQAAAGDPDLAPITAALATIALVGGAVFAVHIGAKVWGWLRKVL